MTDTTIKIPHLTPGLSYTVDVLDPSDDSVLQAGIALTLSGTTGSGIVTASVAQKAAFVVKHGANQIEQVPRLRTIADDAGPYVILTGLDSLAAGGGTVFSVLTLSDDEDYTTLFGICFDQFGQPENDVDITIKLTSGDGTAGVIMDTQQRTQTSATVVIDDEEVVGYVEFVRVRIGSTWSIVRGDVDESSSSPFAVRSAGPTGSVTATTYPSQPLTQVLGQE